MRAGPSVWGLWQTSLGLPCLPALPGCPCWPMGMGLVGSHTTVGGCKSRGEIVAQGVKRAGSSLPAASHLLPALGRKGQAGGTLRQAGIAAVGKETAESRECISCS